MHSVDKISRVSVSVHEWFQKSYGNTYHKASVTVEYFGLPAVTLHNESMIYGGQGHWAHSVGALLLQARLVPRNLETTAERQAYGVLRSLEEDGITVDTDVREVSRKRDL